MSVSYTHLDVYKRQLDCSVLFVQKKCYVERIFDDGHCIQHVFQWRYDSTLPGSKRGGIK